MTAQATTQANPIARSNLLRYTLRSDALVTLASGAICLADAQPLAIVLGIQPALG